MPRFAARILKYLFTISAATILVVVMMGWYYLLTEMDGVVTSHSVASVLTQVSDKGTRYGAVAITKTDMIQDNSPHRRHSPLLSHHPHSLVTTVVHSSFPQTSVDPDPFNTDVRSIHSDLLRCSLNMGISEDTLRKNTGNIRHVEQSAVQFLDAVRLVVPKPSHFTRHKNPSFYSNVTIGNHLSEILMTYLRPEVSKGLIKLQKFFSSNRLLKMSLRRKSLMCLPYFYIAGFPKCATTSLHDALRKHPQVVGPSSKEPHWWTRVDDLSNVTNFPQDYAMFYVWTYLTFFKKACEKIDGRDGDDIVTYDGSQSLLWDSNFFQDGQDFCAMPAVLSRIQPKAKFIVIMRNPTERLYSHFVWSFKYHLGNLKNWPAKIRQNASESFHSEVVSVTKRFKDCLKVSSLFECASGAKLHMDRAKKSVSQIGHKFYIGLYYVHIKKWLHFFPREQFLFLRMENIVANFKEAMGQIIDFLALSPVANREVEKWLTKANSQIEIVAADEKFLMQTQTQVLLDEAYAPYNQLLADLLNDERYLWSE